MGSYAELRLGRLYIGSDKDGINPLVMSLFRDSEKRARRGPYRTPETVRLARGEEDDPDDEVTIIEYACPAYVARDRLELMGFTLDVVQKAFNSAIEAAEKRSQAWYDEWIEKNLDESGGEFMRQHLAERRELRLPEWLDGLREIREKNMRPTREPDDDYPDASPIARQMLQASSDRWYEFPGIDVRHVIRLAIEVSDEHDELVYDLTDLVEGGYWDTPRDVTAYADDLLAEDFVLTRRVIVLTEGATDKWIIEASLKLLYPHLADFFSFMDFEGARVAGGAAALVNLVKAFAGVGIVNRMIAVFDNDTAGTGAMRTLRDVPIPPNIAVVQLPPLALAAHYPTLGPGGVARMDVNGLAASLELYLGADVLEDAEYGFLPVQWRGFDSGVRQYQGEIMQKSLVHDRFRAKLARSVEDSAVLKESDWEGLHLVIGQLRTAFQSVDGPALILEEATFLAE